MQAEHGKRRLRSRWVVVLASFLIGQGFVAGQDTGKTDRRVYLNEPRRTLTVYYPDDWSKEDRRAALVIYRCNITMQREHFRRLGMVVIKPQAAPVNSGNLPSMSLDEIRVAPKPRDQVADCKSAIRYIRGHADELGIDPQRIVATGTSGGGDLALQTAINRSFQHPGDEMAISCIPSALVLYCPAFDGIDIWFVRNREFQQRVATEAPSFTPFLKRFIQSTDSEFAQPLDHRASLIELARMLGEEEGLQANETEAFQDILTMFNERDWQLLAPAEDALSMSASRILTRDPLPPTILLFGDRDHLKPYQDAFVKRARELEQRFELKIYKGGGHSFMTQTAFEEPSTLDVQSFLERIGILPIKP